MSRPVPDCLSGNRIGEFVAGFIRAGLMDVGSKQDEGYRGEPRKRDAQKYGAPAET